MAHKSKLAAKALKKARKNNSSISSELKKEMRTHFEWLFEQCCENINKDQVIDKLLDLLQDIVNLCIDAWNIETLLASEKDWDFILTKKIPSLELQHFVKGMAILKRRFFPGEHGLVVKAEPVIKNEEIFVKSEWDFSFMEEEMRNKPNSIPSYDDLLDHDAIKYALEGVPSEYQEIVMRAEIQKQLDQFNKSLQDESEVLPSGQITQEEE